MDYFRLPNTVRSLPNPIHKNSRTCIAFVLPCTWEKKKNVCNYYGTSQYRDNAEIYNHSYGLAEWPNNSNNNNLNHEKHVYRGVRNTHIIIHYRTGYKEILKIDSIPTYHHIRLYFIIKRIVLFIIYASLYYALVLINWKFANE